MDIYIRWLGAFAKGKAKFDFKVLKNALEYEYRVKHVKACEKVVYPRTGVRSPIGLIYAPTAIQRIFRRDCWSYRRSNGALGRGRLNKYSDHNECWIGKLAKPLGIVYKRKNINTKVLVWLKNYTKAKKIELVEWGQLPAFYKSRT